MFDKSFSIFINRPVTEVFAYITDPQSTPEWASKVVAARVEPPGELAVGSQIVQQAHLPLRTIESAFDKVIYESSCNSCRWR